MAKGKKCIPGVVCVENLTLGFLVIVTVLAFGFMYVYASKQKGGSGKNSENSENVSLKYTGIKQTEPNPWEIF